MPEELRPIDIVLVGAQMQAAYITFWEAFEAYQDELHKNGLNTPRTLTLQSAAHKEQKKFIELRAKYLTATKSLPLLR